MADPAKKEIVHALVLQLRAPPQRLYQRSRQQRRHILMENVDRYDT